MSNPFGGILGEEITQGDKRRIWVNPEDGKDVSLYTGRVFFFVIVCILGLGLLILKLFSLTIIEGDKYRKLSSENRLAETKILSPRGIIYDRNGKILVRNIPIFILPAGEIFYENAPSTVSATFKESIARDYIYKDDIAHVLGYVGEADEEELKTQNSKLPSTPLGTGKDHKLELGDEVGKIGIEKAYDEWLRGTNGRQMVEVDAKGREIRVLGKLDPVVGKNINLSIDVDLQKIAREELIGKKGALVAQNPKTGEILALFSSPSFDPNRLIRRMAVEELLFNPNQPFFDRAISGLYPPGSTFKPVIAIAALESGAINKETKFEDTGILQVGQFSFSNWYFTQYGKKEGMVDIVTALKRSNDIFFYKTGEATGIDTIALWAKKIGLSNKLGVDIGGEARGIMPDPSWRKKVLGTDWYLGDTYHVAIGQGDLQVTPLQVNGWTNLIADDGKLCRPHLLKEQITNNRQQRPECKDLGIKKETIALIKEGMREACSPGGTGWPFFKFKVQSSKFKVDGIDFLETFESTTAGKPMIEIPVACKTGTAEFGDPQNLTHAWFTVFAPVANPQISVTVLVEGGGEGSNVAAPIAKKILEKWFGN